MQYPVLNFYELLTVLAPFALLSISARGRRALPRGAMLPGLVFAIYVCGALHFTGAGTLFDAMRYGLPASSSGINLLPFSQAIDWQGYLLNVVLFLPLGILAPLLWPSCARPGRTALAGLSFSLLIEVSQLLNLRSPDVDDLLLNTAGALLGYLLFRLLPPKWKERAAGLPYGPLPLAGALFLGRFLLFNELYAARLLYGF